MRILNLQPYTHEHKSELHDTLTTPSTPMGIHINMWGGWEWELDFEDGTDPVPMHTNGEGEGLWSHGKQSLGTCQFSLPRKRDAARRAIRRHWQRLMND